MKVLKTCLLMLAILVSLALALRAAQEFDILDLIPTIARGGSKCNFTRLKQMFTKYASDAAAKVVAADKTAVSNYVSTYAEGGAPPTATPNAQGSYDLTIPSRAAAFYVAGAQAVLQGNKLVALWCFTEAAQRNPRVPMFLNNAAFALIEFGYLADARQALECAISLDPDYVSAYVNLGKALAGQGNFAAAGDNYRTALAKFPTNPDYCRLAAEAYKQAGMNADAWAMGSLGKAAFPTSYDWDAFLNSVNYQPSVSGDPCPCWDQCYPVDSCYNLWEKITQLNDEYYQKYQTYIDNVETPAISVADQHDEQCCIAKEVRCSAYPPVLYDICCYCKNNIQYSRCDTLKQIEYIDIYNKTLAFGLDSANNFYNMAMSQYNASKNKLTECQTTNILCWINLNRNLLFQNAVENYLAFYNISVASIDINNKAISDFSKQMIGCYNSPPTPSNPNPPRVTTNDAAYTNWVLTGNFTAAMEPKYCYAFYCLSADDQGTVGFEMKAGLALKFSYNPYNGNMGVNVGVGIGGGAGAFDVSGTVWLKFSNTHVGVEAKLNIGPGKIGGYYGFEHL